MNEKPSHLYELDLLVFFVPCSLLFLVSGLVLESVGPSGSRSCCWPPPWPSLRDFRHLGQLSQREFKTVWPASIRRERAVGALRPLRIWLPP